MTNTIEVVPKNFYFRHVTFFSYSPAHIQYGATFFRAINTRTFGSRTKGESTRKNFVTALYCTIHEKLVNILASTSAVRR
jgi:hypothetical protein